MAEDKKQKNQADKEIKKSNNSNLKKTSADTTLEEAKKNLTDTKKDIKKNDVKIKQMTAYQEQVLQEATKSKGNKKILIILLLLLGFAVVVGVGIALFFILKPKPQEQSAIVCDVRVLSYSVQHNVNPEKYEVLNEYDEFHFTKDTEKTGHFTKDLVANLTLEHDIAMVYVINNTSEKDYTYSLNFDDLIIKNCTITIKTSLNDELVYINDTKRSLDLSYDKDITLEIRISVDDESIANENNTGCEGVIGLTLSVE